MLCDDCRKNEANIHITQISAEGKVDKNLCAECAARYESSFMQGRRDETSNDFLKGVFGTVQDELKYGPAKNKSLHCPKCGMTYRDFSQTGKIGCSSCYNTFREFLQPVLRRIHGGSTHTGKIPKRTGREIAQKQQIRFLRRKLEEAVAEEAYEAAAGYRDQIKQLEKAQKGEAGNEGK